MRHGFSFTEIMFAVIILGIGFIMVAAIFPVAIQQAKMTSEETSAAALARGMANKLERIFKDGPNRTTAFNNTSSNCPPQLSSGTIPPQATATMPGFVQQAWSVLPASAPAGSVYPASLWKSAANDLIFAEDPRFACIFLYRRQGQTNQPDGARTWSSFVQLYIFPVQVQAQTVFNATSDTKVPANYNLNTARWSANLQAREVQIAVVHDYVPLGGIDLIAFDIRGGVPAYKRVNVLGPGLDPARPDGAPTEGAYVIVANDKITSPAANAGRMNGLIFRLGPRHTEFEQNAGLPSPFPAPFDSPTLGKCVVYELQSGSGFTPDPGADGVVNTADDIKTIGLGPATADAFLIGRGYSSETLSQIATGVAAPTLTYEGAAMPIGVYTTFVKVN